MVHFSEIQHFPGNFRIIYPRFEIFGMFDRTGKRSTIQQNSPEIPGREKSNRVEIPGKKFPKIWVFLARFSFPGILRLQVVLFQRASELVDLHLTNRRRFLKQ